jgi:hypothetical protein
MDQPTQELHVGTAAILHAVVPALHSATSRAVLRGGAPHLSASRGQRGGRDR